MTVKEPSAETAETWVLGGRTGHEWKQLRDSSSEREFGREFSRAMATLQNDITARAQREARSAFFEERLGELGTTIALEEREDLSRRLLEAIDALESSADRLQLIDSSENAHVHRELETVWIHQRSYDSPNQREVPETHPRTLAALESLRFRVFSSEAIGALHRVFAAYVWPTVVWKWKTQHASKLATREVLMDFANDSEQPDSLATHEDAEPSLKIALDKHLQAARRAMALPSELDELRDLGEVEGMCTLDAMFTNYVASSPEISQAAPQLSSTFTAANAQRRTCVEPPYWLRWKDPLLLPRLLARVLWQCVVRPQIEYTSANPPALAEGVVRVLDQAWFQPGRRVEQIGQDKFSLVSSRGDVLATIATVPTEKIEMMQRMPQITQRLTAHKMIRYLPRKAHQNKLAERPNYSILFWEGGVPTLGDELGTTSHKDHTTILEVLDIGKHATQVWPHGKSGGLWTYDHDDASGPNRRAYLEVRIGAMLEPHYAKRHLPKNEQFLLPVVELPPFYGRPRGYAAQAAFQWRLLGALLDRRVELVKEGGALLAREELMRLAVPIGVPVTTLDKVIECWLAGTTSTAPFLERVSEDRQRYTLANNETFGDARRFLEIAGQRTLENRKRGKESVRAARQPRRRRPMGKAGGRNTSPIKPVGSQ